MSCHMGKPTICMCETKTQVSFAVTAKLISAFVFATRIVQFFFYLNLKFQASSSFLCLYRSVCVGPVRKPHCWFSHEEAQIINKHFCSIIFLHLSAPAMIPLPGDIPLPGMQLKPQGILKKTSAYRKVYKLSFYWPPPKH